MTFDAVKLKVIGCLKTGNYDAVERDDIETKKLLKTGKLSAANVIELLNYTKMSQFFVEEHDLIKGLDVYFFLPKAKELNWYIKFYFIDPLCFFISVHESHIRETTKKQSGKK